MWNQGLEQIFLATKWDFEKAFIISDLLANTTVLLVHLFQELEMSTQKPSLVKCLKIKLATQVKLLTVAVP